MLAAHGVKIISAYGRSSSIDHKSLFLNSEMSNNQVNVLNFVFLTSAVCGFLLLLFFFSFAFAVTCIVTKG